MKTALFLVLAVLWILAAAMLYWAPVRRYAVTCERTIDLACVLEQTRASRTLRTTVPLGAMADAVVRIIPQRRGASRVLLELQTRERAVFAAEFEGPDADVAAYAAATRLNTVLRSRTAPARVSITAVPPPLYAIAAWCVLGVMGLLTLAGFREARRGAPPR